MKSLNLTSIDEAIATAIAHYEPKNEMPVEEIVMAAEKGRRYPRYDAVMANIALSTSATNLYRDLVSIQESAPKWAGLRQEADRWIEGAATLPTRIAEQLRFLFAPPALVPTYRSFDQEVQLPIDPANQALKPGTLEALGAAEVKINGQPALASDQVSTGDTVEAVYVVASSDDWVVGSTQVTACFVTLSPEEAFDLEWAEAAASEAPVVAAMLMFRAGQFGKAERLLENWPADEYLAPYAQAVRGSASARRRDAATILD